MRSTANRYLIRVRMFSHDRRERSISDRAAAAAANDRSAPAATAIPAGRHCTRIAPASRSDCGPVPSARLSGPRVLAHADHAERWLVAVMASINGTGATLSYVFSRQLPTTSTEFSLLVVCGHEATCSPVHGGDVPRTRRTRHYGAGQHAIPDRWFCSSRRRTTSVRMHHDHRRRPVSAVALQKLCELPNNGATTPRRLHGRLLQHASRGSSATSARRAARHCRR